MYKPHLFAEILSQKSRVRLIHETIALKGSKLACRGHKLVTHPQSRAAEMVLKIVHLSTDQHMASGLGWNLLKTRIEKHNHCQVCQELS